MLMIDIGAHPDKSLLLRYAAGGTYTDWYTTRIPGSVSHSDFVTAFYTTCLFKLERLILRWAIAKPSIDSETRELALGERGTFAAWTVKDRSDNQLLRCDLYGRTRSWLMTLLGKGGTELYFGSAVLPTRSSPSMPAAMSFGSVRCSASIACTHVACFMQRGKD